MGPLRYGIADELHDFAEAVATGRPPEVGPEEGTRASLDQYRPG